MNFILALLAWGAIALILCVGLFLLAAKGIIWPFAIMMVLFIVAVGKIGCAVH